MIPCPHCGTPFRAKRHHGKRQRYCSLACANRHQAWAKLGDVQAAYDLPDDAALRRWLVDQLNRRTVTTVAHLCGVQRQALYQWMERLGIRKVVRYE